MRIWSAPLYAQTTLGVRSLVNIGQDLNWPALEARVDWCEKNRVDETPMGLDLNQFANRYTAAWCSQHAASVASFFAVDGSLKINDGAPAIGREAITSSAQGFMTAFPNLVVKMDRLAVNGTRTEYHWTLTGTNTGPGGTGKFVRISGFEEWRFTPDGLIAESIGHFDAAEYQRQLYAEETRSIPEISSPMLDVHAPHETIHTWKSFFIHIATIVVGLFIAVSLEQTVEFFHHRHIRQQLEAQMLQVFAGDLQSDATSIEEFDGFRDYLFQLRAAIIARLDGKQEPAPPPSNDPRMATFAIFPSLAPYDAAKENGTVAYLPTARIRIYNRVAFQRELAATAREHRFGGLAALAAFNERYTDSIGNLEMGAVSPAPDLTKLARPELTEYIGIVAALIKQTDLETARIRLFDKESRAILDGVQDEETLLKVIGLKKTRP